MHANYDWLEILDWAPKVLILVIFVALLVNGFLNRNAPRVGGKIGRRIAAPDLQVPDGCSRVTCCEITNFCAPPSAEGYATLKSYVHNALLRRRGLVHIYRLAGCSTRIEIAAASPHYDRIDAAQALALLRELPDARLVARLHLSDEPSFLDPWTRKVTGTDVCHLGNATSTGLVILYMPDRRLGRELGITLLHEWLHLLAFDSGRTIRRFRRANRIEALAPLQFEPHLPGHAMTPVYEAWCELGEKLLGYDETLARQTALAVPLHAMILWRCVANVLRKVPRQFTSSRLAEFQARAAFMQMEVAPQERAARRKKRE